MNAMRVLFTLLFLVMASALPSAAAPTVKVINFTADWCPNCQILNPRLDEAISAFEDGSVERIDMDVTGIRRDTPLVEKGQIQAELIQLAHEHQVRYLIDWYGGITGIAVAVAADTGEPLGCFMRPMKAKDIEKRLNLAKILAEKGKPGTRQPDALNCPVLK